MVSATELYYYTNASAVQMATTIFGSGTTVNSASYTGSKNASAIYTGGDSISPDATPGNTGVILSTGRAKLFTNSSGEANKSTSTGSNTSGPDNQADFNAIAGLNTYDAAYLDINFTPTGNVMTIQFVFSSEEYPEYLSYNDSVGVWINGAHVPLSVANSAASVDTVSNLSNPNLYNDNTADQFNTEMDGFTVTMTLTIPVNVGVANIIRIGIADAGDSKYDSNLLIAADSVQTTLVAIDDQLQMFAGGTSNLDVLTNDVNVTGGTLQITHINGNAVVVGSSVTLPSGHIVTLKADGTFDITADQDIETAAFTYGVKSVNNAGQTIETDTGFISVETIPCFVAGTMIRTPEGEVAVELLREGDLVNTLDDGPQPLRWTGRRDVPAVGKMAPVRFAAGTYGTHRTLLVSPQHRILVRDYMTNIFFGEDEVLVSAKDLVNGKTVRRIEGGSVTYVHILFDKHQVVWSEGLATESFLPGPQTHALFERDIIDEICAIFPELDPTTGSGYSPAARRTLRAFEAKLLLADAA
jgi:hypothetical protein